MIICQWTVYSVLDGKTFDFGYETFDDEGFSH